MNTYSTLARAAAVLAGIALSVPAMAATIDIGAGVSGSAGQSGMSADAALDAGVTVGTTSDDMATSSDASDASIDVRGSGMFDATAVSTQDDLDAYVSASLSRDARIENVSASDEEVSVEYQEPARLFGIFPVTVTATATAHANGDVTIDYPWYRFLMSTEREALESSLAAEVRAAMNGNGAEASAEMSAQTQARVVEALHRAMKAHHDAAISADADASAEASY